MIAASCLALILLLFFQVNWLRHSRQLIEEQFDQKVTMAICSAVESLGSAENISPKQAASCRKMDENCFASCLSGDHTEVEMHDALAVALQRYDIDLDFKFDVVNSSAPESIPTTFCANETPLTLDNQAVHVSFSDKEKYIIEKMGFMTATSIFILLFVSSMLLMALVKFLRQKQLNEVSVEFFNNMAHEFRTPLTNMQLALSLLNKRNPETADSKYVQILRGENKRLLEQVERMLHVAKLERGEYQLEIEDINLEALVKEVIEDMNIQLAERGGEISLQNQAQMPIRVQGDRLHLSNSIRNIIDNALKYCDRQPCISIQMNQNEQFAYLNFQDNGIGISSQHRRLIFEKFQRGLRGDVQNQKGFGLGLAYVKRVIERHGGSVKLSSEVDRGSQFNLTLPLKPHSHA